MVPREFTAILQREIMAERTAENSEYEEIHVVGFIDIDCSECCRPGTGFACFLRCSRQFVS